MSTPRVLILRAPGTNCDGETAYAFERAGGKPEVLHLNRLLEASHLAAEYQILCLPGGFSFGDDIAAGRIFADQIRHHLNDVMAEFKEAGKLILGVCNGFQVLLKSGLLLPEENNEPVATLTWNDSGKFEDRWVHLAAEGEKCVFLQGAEQLYLPVAHAEGKFIARDESVLASLEAAGQLVLKYARPNGDASEVVPFPYNPNGSPGNVAGVCDASGRIFGLMPHPERHLDFVQHPHWTRLPERDRGDGLLLFENAVRYFA